MKKFLFLALAAMIVFAPAAFAKHNEGCPPNNPNCNQTGETGDIDITNKNTNTNMNLINQSNRTDVDVENTNVNVNVNKNTNVNMNKQGQAQGQVQGQGQKQSIVIEDNVDYNHISPDIGKTDANLLDHGGASDIRTLNSIFKYDDDEFITMDEAKKASSGANIEVIKALLWEADTQLDKLNYMTMSGKYMGSMTLLTDDATLDQVIARACKEAMYAGATSVSFVLKDAKKVSATKYGIDFGSSASVAAQADGSIIVAPGATLGWSKTKASNIMVGEVYIMLFRDESLIRE